MKKWKSEKGSITLFVLIALLFFIGVLLSSYLSSINSRRAQDDATKRVKEIYEKDVGRMNEIYNEIAKELEPPPVTTKVNAPDIAMGMQPVKFDETHWIVTNEADPEWYNYDNSVNKWANAILVEEGKTYSEGEIVEEETADFYVWIPRFHYDSTSLNIEFVEGQDYGDEMVHPAFSRHIYHADFTDGTLVGTGEERDVELAGFWMSKHRVSQNTQNNSLRIARKGGNLLKKYLGARNATADGESYMGLVLDSYGDATIQRIANTGKEYAIHMQTMREYGAVAYLSCYAYGGKIPTDCIEGDPDANTGAWSCNGNETGVYDLVGEGELVLGLFSDQEYPFQDQEWNLGDINYSGIGIGAVDNLNRATLEGEKTTNAMGFDHGLFGDLEEITSYDVSYRVGIQTPFNASVIDSNEIGSFHSTIIDTKI